MLLVSLEKICKLYYNLFVPCCTGCMLTQNNLSEACCESLFLDCTATLDIIMENKLLTIFSSPVFTFSTDFIYFLSYLIKVLIVMDFVQISIAMVTL